MNLDALLDRPEPKAMRTSAVVVFIALGSWLPWRHDSVDGRIRQVCRGLYQNAHSAAESAAVDTSRTMVRGERRGQGVASEPCGELRRAGRLRWGALRPNPEVELTGRNDCRSTRASRARLSASRRSFLRSPAWQR